MLVVGSFLACDAVFLQGFNVKKDGVIGFFHAAKTVIVGATGLRFPSKINDFCFYLYSSNFK